MRDEGEHKGDSEAVDLGESRCRDAEGVNLRRATVEDADFLVELLTHEDVEPYLSAISAKDREGIVAGIERSEQEPELFGQFIVEVDGRPAGTLRFENEIYGFNQRSLAHAERVGWVREGVKRKAYWRHGDWVDGVVFGLLAEDL